MTRYLCPPFLVLILLLSGGGAPAAPVAVAAEPVQGDVTCDSTVNSIDSLQILRDVAGLATTAQCLAAAGDVNCDASPNSIDALGILRHVAGLNVQTPDGCTPIGDALGPLSPQVLAARLNAAADTGHAEALLRLVYPEIDVGLYTGDGQQILAGAETGPDDFYLYDSESELLARNYVERQLFGLHTSTLFLEEAGVVDVDSGQPLSDAEVLSMLADGVAAARADESLFTWRLIDELGLAQEEPLDLAAPGIAPATTYLDSVQTFLILYDVTSGLPVSTGASAEVSADGPNARTKALHDYSLLAQGYNASIRPVAPTHWKHDASSVAEERTLTADLYFAPGPEVMRGFTAGPLRLVALPPLAPTTAPVTWLGTELLKNGAWKKLANTDETNVEGEASIVFVPKTECRPGEGSVQTKAPTVIVTFLIEVKSAFFPHKFLGLITKVVKTEVEVSRHTGGGAASAGGAATLAARGAADPSSGLPCAYEGTASATQNYPDALGGTETRTITASDLRFELKPPDSPFEGLYELVRGTVTVQVDGTQGDCTISGSYSIPEPIDDGVHFFAGFIILHPQNNRYFAGGGQGDWEEHLVLDCPPPLGRTFVPAALSGEPVWLRTNTSQFPDLPFMPGEALEGSFDLEGPYPGATAHYEWSFDPIVCNPSPQPVCQ